MSTESILSSSKEYIAPFVIPITSIALILWAFHLWQTSSRSYKLALKLPGPPPIPFLGNAHLVMSLGKQKIFEEAIKLSYNYDGAARAFLGYKPVVFLTHPDDVEIILNSSVHLQKADEYKYFEPWFGNGLLISHGETWKNHRKLIAPAFHMNVLKTFINLFYKNSIGVVEKMRSEIGMNNEFDVHDYMSETTVDILLQTVMGSTKKRREKSGYEYAMAVMKMCDILHERHTKFYLRADFLFNLFGLKKKQEKLLGIIQGLTNSVVEEKRTRFDKNLSEGKLPSPSLSEIIANENALNKEVKAPVKKTGLRDDLDDLDENDVGEKRRLAFLDLMLETAHYTHQLTDEDIRNQVDTIMFEGHDTTAAGSSFVLCMLGIHKDVQEKCYQEIKRIFGDSDRPATFADTLEMKYLERVIFETLRMYPPVPIIARKVNQDVKLSTIDAIIPSGTTVVVTTYKIHRRADFYKDPDVFNPDNFLPENTQNRHYYAYVPFAAGPRSCVGRKYAMLKLKVLLSTILRNFKINSNCGEKDFKLTGDIILKRDDGFRILLDPRHPEKMQA
jgi:cytochrome P450 family 4